MPFCNFSEIVYSAHLRELSKVSLLAAWGSQIQTLAGKLVPQPPVLAASSRPELGEMGSSEMFISGNQNNRSGKHSVRCSGNFQFLCFSINSAGQQPPSCVLAILQLTAMPPWEVSEVRTSQCPAVPAGMSPVPRGKPPSLHQQSTTAGSFTCTQNHRDCPGDTVGTSLPICQPVREEESWV